MTSDRCPEVIIPGRTKPTLVICFEEKHDAGEMHVDGLVGVGFHV